MLSVKLLSLGSGRNRGVVAKVVILVAVGDGFQGFGISPVGDADTGDLALFCHIHSLLFFYDGIIGELIPGDSAALFDKTDDPFGVGIRLRDLVQGLLNKFISIHIHRSFALSFCDWTENMQVYKGWFSVI